MCSTRSSSVGSSGSCHGASRWRASGALACRSRRSAARRRASRRGRSGRRSTPRRSPGARPGRSSAAGAEPRLRHRHQRRRGGEHPAGRLVEAVVVEAGRRRRGSGCRAPAGRRGWRRTPPASPTFEASGPVPRAFQRSEVAQVVELGEVGGAAGVPDQRDHRVVLQVAAHPGQVDHGRRCRARARWLPGPMPESISSCGLLIAPPQSSTSRVGARPCARRRPARKVTPGGARPPSSSIRVGERAGARRSRLARSRAGREVGLVGRPAAPALVQVTW